MLQRSHKLLTEELAFFRAFDNEVRLEILRVLEEHERCVNEIAKKVGCDQTTVSHNLRFLSEWGFVGVKREGKNRIYFLSSPSVEKIFNLVKEHFERTQKNSESVKSFEKKRSINNLFEEYLGEKNG